MIYIFDDNSNFKAKVLPNYLNTNVGEPTVKDCYKNKTLA